MTTQIDHNLTTYLGKSTMNMCNVLYAKERWLLQERKRHWYHLKLRKPIFIFGYQTAVKNHHPTTLCSRRFSTQRPVTLRYYLVSGTLDSTPSVRPFIPPHDHNRLPQNTQLLKLQDSDLPCYHIVTWLRSCIQFTNKHSKLKGQNLFSPSAFLLHSETLPKLIQLSLTVKNPACHRMFEQVSL